MRVTLKDLAKALAVINEGAKKYGIENVRLTMDKTPYLPGLYLVTVRSDSATHYEATSPVAEFAILDAIKVARKVFA